MFSNFMSYETDAVTNLKIVIDHHNFVKWLEKEKPHVIAMKIEQKSKAMITLFNLCYVNQVSLMISNSYGEPFTVQLHRTSAKEDNYDISMSVWSTRGESVGKYVLKGSSLYSSYKEKEDSRDDSIKVFTSAVCDMDSYTIGFIKCSKCGATINRYTEIAGTYYAGRFCSTCWEGGVKQEEARENYE